MPQAATAAQVAPRSRALRRITTFERYGVALIAAAIALAAQLALHRLISPNFYPIFLVAVAFSAWYGGFWPGVTTMLLATVGALVAPGPPQPSIDVGQGRELMRLLIYGLSGVVVSWLIASLLVARRRAERAAARTARMQALNLSLAPALPVSEVARVLLHHAIDAMQAGAGAIALYDAEGEALEVIAAQGEPAEQVLALARESAERGPLGQASRDGVPIFLESGAELRARYPGGVSLRGDAGSLAAISFTRDGRPLGAIELRFDHDRRLAVDDRTFLSTLAGQGAQALERARLYAAERAARRHAEEAREQVGFLAEASQILSSSLDYRVTLTSVAQLAVPRLADWCAVDVVEADGRMRRIAIAHNDPAKVEAVWEMSRRYPALAGDPVPQTLRTGKPQLVREISDELLQHFARDPEHLAALRAFGLCSFLVVPLTARGRTVGVLTCVMAESGRHYGDADLLLAEDLARRAALAIDNAGLYRELETALAGREETLALLDTVFAGAPIGLAFHDRDLRFVRINDALAAINRRPISDHLGRTLGEVLGTGAASIEPLLRRVLETGEPVLDQEIRLEQPDRPGEIRTFLASYYPVRGRQGEVHWIGAVVLDVTERKRADELLMQAQRMEAIAKVAGGVAHEVNNMMTVITGFSGFLEETLATGDSRQADLSEIRKAADRAAGITRQLLAYSRQQVLQLRALDVNRLIEEMTGVFRRLLGDRIGLRLRLAPEIAPVKADRAQLEQVFVNLALNARDAMPGIGEFAIETDTLIVPERGRQAPSDPPQGRYVRINVADTGHGMDAETRARIFEPFFTTKPVGQGTGLGLATVYGVVKQSGGFISVQSEPGKGTTFTIWLPELAEHHAAVVQSGEEAVPRAGAETILLVEDEESVRRMAGRALRKSGYTVLEASNGAEALAVVSNRSQPIDLVITDVVMPEMGGRELAERLSRMTPGTPVLYMSGYTDDDVIRRGMLTPGSPFLQKPFEPTTLARKVREVLKR